MQRRYRSRADSRVGKPSSASVKATEVEKRIVTKAEGPNPLVGAVDALGKAVLGGLLRVAKVDLEGASGVTGCALPAAEVLDLVVLLATQSGVAAILQIGALDALLDADLARQEAGAVGPPDAAALVAPTADPLGLRLQRQQRGCLKPAACLLRTVSTCPTCWRRPFQREIGSGGLLRMTRWGPAGV